MGQKVAPPLDPKGTKFPIRLYELGFPTINTENTVRF